MYIFIYIYIYIYICILSYVCQVGNFVSTCTLQTSFRFLSNSWIIKYCLPVEILKVSMKGIFRVQFSTCSNLIKNPLMENFIFCTGSDTYLGITHD